MFIKCQVIHKLRFRSENTRIEVGTSQPGLIFNLKWWEGDINITIPSVSKCKLKKKLKTVLKHIILI